MGYRSKFEQNWHNSRQHLEYEPHRLEYVIKHHYTPDFWDKSTNTYYETKGLWKSVDRTKLLQTLLQNPSLNIVMVFQNPNLKLSKKSHTSYGQWCDKHDIKWIKG